MQQLLHNTGRQTGAPALGGLVETVAKPVGRFMLHLAEMCLVMCSTGLVLSLLFFEGAALLGYTDLPQTAPELSVLVIAINLSVPMAAWMRYRGMGWQSTLEMTVPTMATGVALVVAYWLDLVAKSSLIEIQTSLACPVMVVVMLLRFRLYSTPHAGHPATSRARATR